MTDLIKIEVGLRESVIDPAIVGAAKTLLLDPIGEVPLVEPVKVNCLSRLEASAEKFRAALSRRDVAIRDFYDLDHAVQRQGLKADAADVIDLVRKKLGVPGNEADDVSAVRRTRFEVRSPPNYSPFCGRRTLEILISIAHSGSLSR
jgi:hypothetical protein